MLKDLTVKSDSKKRSTPVKDHDHGRDHGSNTKMGQTIFINSSLNGPYKQRKKLVVKLLSGF